MLLLHLVQYKVSQHSILDTSEKGIYHLGKNFTDVCGTKAEVSHRMRV
jgi:hypothetical protein